MRIFKATKTEATARFYGDLLGGQRTRWFWGTQRFDAEKASRSASIARYFTQPVSELLSPEARVLDVGCGAGILLPLVAPLCRQLVGLEVAAAFAEASRQVVECRRLENVVILEGSVEHMPFGDGEFDVLVAVDVLHHVFDLPACVAELHRVLRPGGRLIVYEPNKLNPLLALLCCLDRNEWGLLSLGTTAAYRHLLAPGFDLETVAYSGLIIGPDNRFNRALAGFLNRPAVRRRLGWLNPKIQIVARKPAGDADA